METEKETLYLKQVPLFADLADEEVRDLMTVARRRAFRAGEIMCSSSRETGRPACRSDCVRAAYASSSFRDSSARQSAWRPASFDLSRSVAMTLAPSAAKSSAVSRPIPAPAAVRNAIFPLRRPATSISLKCFLHVHDPAIAHRIHPLDRIAAPLIPGNIVDE